MSIDAALQKLIFERLTSYAPLTALIGDRVYDGVPEDRVFPYVSFVSHSVVEDDADCITGDEHRITLDIWTREDGRFRSNKIITKAAKDALHLYSAEPESGALVELRAIARRYLLDRDGLTSHGVLTIDAMTEDA